MQTDICHSLSQYLVCWSGSSCEASSTCRRLPRFEWHSYKATAAGAKYLGTVWVTGLYKAQQSADQMTKGIFIDTRECGQA